MISFTLMIMVVDQIPELGPPYICVRLGLRARGLALETSKFWATM